jgi:hypothetical protein
VKRVNYCLAWVVAALTLGACGASVSQGGVNGPPSLGGIWKGQLTGASGVTLPTLILVTEDGRFMSVAENAVDDCADVAQGNLLLNGYTVSGEGNIGIISATGDVGVQVDCDFSDGSVWGTAALTGSVSPRSTLTLTEDNSTSLGTALPSTFGSLFFDDAYNETSSLGKVAGNWVLSTGALLSINAGGILLSKDTANGCEINGKVTIVNEKYNAYAVAATYSNCSASASALNDLNATGLLTVDDTQNPAVLYIGYSMTLSNGEVLMVAVNGTGG